MGLKDLAKKKLLQQELETVDEDESTSDEGESASDDPAAPGFLKKKKKRFDVASGFRGKLDQEGTGPRRMNPLKMWASKMTGRSEDSDS